MHPSRAGYEKSFPTLMNAGARPAGSMAHDLRNVLAGILGYAEMLFEELDQGSAHKRYAGNVLAAAGRAHQLLEEALLEARTSRSLPHLVDATQVALEVLDLVRGTLPHGVYIEVRGLDRPALVRADAMHLYQLLMNLCTNAVDAMEQGGRLWVELSHEKTLMPRSLSHGSLVPGCHTALAVHDTGAGMDAATLARIFEPFFTTKRPGKGNGIGLAVVRDIAAEWGAAIDVVSSPGRGTRFTIYLRTCS